MDLKCLLLLSKTLGGKLHTQKKYFKIKALLQFCLPAINCTFAVNFSLFSYKQPTFSIAKITNKKKLKTLDEDSFFRTLCSLTKSKYPRWLFPFFPFYKYIFYIFFKFIFIFITSGAPLPCSKAIGTVCRQAGEEKRITSKWKAADWLGLCVKEALLHSDMLGYTMCLCIPGCDWLKEIIIIIIKN